MTPEVALAIAEVMHAADLPEIEEKGKVSPNLLQMIKYISYTHSAVFAEVRIDEDLGVIRVTRIVCAAAAGRILNPKTARSQILGGVVMGIGMALHEEAMTDHRFGKIMNHNFAEYHIPSHADIEDIEVIFVDENDEKVSPLGVKGLGRDWYCRDRSSCRECNLPRHRQTGARFSDYDRQVALTIGVITPLKLFDLDKLEKMVSSAMLIKSLG